MNPTLETAVREAQAAVDELVNHPGVHGCERALLFKAAMKRVRAALGILCKHSDEGGPASTYRDIETAYAAIRSIEGDLVVRLRLTCWTSWSPSTAHCPACRTTCLDQAVGFAGWRVTHQGCRVDRLEKPDILVPGRMLILVVCRKHREVYVLDEVKAT